MTVRLLAIPLKFHFLVTCIAITTPLKEDLLLKIITLNATRLEYNESESIELNCSSSRKSIGNGAEFIVNGLTVEHISFRDNKCYNRKMEECITDHCQCFPSDMLYIYEHTDTVLATELIVGCRMRFADNKTSTIIKAFISLRFNGTVSALYKYDVKMLKQDTENNIDENKNNNSMEHISRWLPALCGVLFFISAVSIVFICRVWRRHTIYTLPMEDKIRFDKLLQTEEKEKRYFVRVMIVGKESTGKTSLLRRLLKEGISDVTSTDGVDIVVCRCKINIKNGKWTIGKEIDDDKVNRIKRALSPNAEDKDIKKSEMDEARNMHIDVHSESSFYKKDIRTDRVISMDKNEDNNESISLIQSTSVSTDVNLDYRQERNESSSLVMPKNLMSCLFSKSTVNTTSNRYAFCELWDFAGQKEFYATHQAFLTSCAVYLVVADMKDDISKPGLSQCFAEFQHIGEYVEFWFDSIHCHRTDDYIQHSYGHFDPPIILVFTGKDKYDKVNFMKRKNELNDQIDQVLGLQGKYHHLHYKFYLSNKEDSDEVFEKLRYAISEAARKMDNWGKAFPLKWILLEHLIEINKNSGINFMNFNDMSNLAKHPDIHMLEKEDLLLFLRFQHSVGKIIFFEHIRDLIILRPKWLADAFRCLVSDRIDNTSLHHREDWTLFIRQGKISESLITELFKSKVGSQFSEQKNNLQKVMEELDILIKIENSSYYIIPSMMPSATFYDVCRLFGIYSKHCSRTSWLCFKFKFLPPSFFNHLSAWFIRNYNPSKVDTGIALYRGICMFDMEGSGCTKILVAMSTDTIALQVVSFSKQQAVFGSTCSDIYSKVTQLIEDIKNRYNVKISFKLHFKCSDGYYYQDTFEYDQLTRNEECFCIQHRNVHRSEQMYSPWIKKMVKRSHDYREKIVLMQDDLYPKPNKAEAFTQDLATVKNKLPVSVKLREQFKINGSGSLEISSCIKIGDRLVVTDPGERRLIICNSDGSDLHYVPVQATPSRIAKIDGNTVAVSFCFQQTIQIINIYTDSVTCTINTSGHCGGISYNDNNLYVVIHDTSIIHVMDLTGKVIRTITFSPDVGIYNIIVDKDRLICVNRTSIHYCSLDGKVIWEFKHDEYQDLDNVTTDTEGNLYATNCSTNSVIVVSDDGTNYRELLSSESDEFNEPFAIYFDKKENILLVCSQNVGKAFLFDVKMKPT